MSQEFIPLVDKLACNGHSRRKNTGAGRCWWNCGALKKATLMLLGVIIGLALLLAAGMIFLERDSMHNECDMRERLNGSERISSLQCKKFKVTPYVIDHIFNGTAAQFGEFPYMAALGYGMPNGSDSANSPTLFRCGASLISPSYLLTAAHCLLGVPVFARLGVLELQPETVVDEPLDIAIKKRIPHPDYRAVPLQHDIGLLELEKPINATWSFIKPACLYQKIAERGSLDSVYTLSVQGWGWTDMYESNSSRLMKANVTIIEHKECNSIIPDTRLLKAGVYPGLLCALGRNIMKETTGDTCTGDSGGPLMLHRNSRNYLIGITSQGTMCGGSVPGIYTEVARYLEWIESIVWSNERITTHH